MLQVIILVIGFVLLIKGADIFVDGASSTAQNLKVSKMVIGLTIVAFGTSAPEMAVSFNAIMKHSGDMVLGNVIGSNILNILLIIGISSFFCKLKVQSNTIKKEIPITLLMSLLLVTLFVDNIFDNKMINQISRSDGLVILLFFTIFIYYLFSIMRKNKDNSKEEPPHPLGKSLLFTLIGLIGVILGSNLVVDSATEIAKYLGVSERMISLTIIAFGTSLPELVTSIISAKKGEQDLLIGNIIGSNIFNIGIVLGIPILLFGGIIGTGFSYLDLVVLIVAALMLFISSINDKVISKKEGFIMLLTFVTYYSYVIFS